MTSDPVARYLSTRGSTLGRRARLRVMSTSEVLDTAMRAYRLMGWNFLRLTVVPALFSLSAIAFVLEYVLPSLGSTHSANSITGQLLETSGTLLLALFVGGPLLLIGVSFACAVVIHQTSDYMAGNVPDPESAVGAARRMLPRLAGLGFRELLVSLSGVALAVACMMAGGLVAQYTPETSIWAGVLAVIGLFGLLGGFLVFLHVVGVHALSPAVCLVEDASATVAAKRSKELLKGFGHHPSGLATVWSTYFVMGLVTLIEWAGLAATFELFGAKTALEGLFAGVPFQGLILAAIDLLPPFLVVWTIIPVWATTITILYYERRIRLEGYDIEALAQDIARSGTSSRFRL